MKRYKIIVGGMLVLFIYGCRTIPSEQTDKQLRDEAVQSLGTVASAISGKEITEDDLRDLNKQIRNDEEAKQAVDSITDALTGENTVIKYCPIDGARFAPHIQKCPEHNIDLEILQH